MSNVQRPSSEAPANLHELAATIRGRMEQLALDVPALTERARCGVLDVNRVLSGDPATRVDTLLAVTGALGLSVFAVPEDARRGVGDGFAVTEPRVETVVEKALKRVRARLPRAAGRFVLFCDLDGLVHAAGDSRIDDQGQLTGDKLFRWLPRLEAVLADFPQVDVVIHSSWRKYWPTLESLSALLPSSFAARVVDITDPQVLDRQDSINEYLLDHPDVTGWLILDDEPEEFDAGCLNLLACNPQTGMGDRDFEQQLRSRLAEAFRGETC